MHELRTLSDEDLEGLTTGELILLASEYHLIDAAHLTPEEFHVVLGMHELSFAEEEGRDILLRLLKAARAILAQEEK